MSEGVCLPAIRGESKVLRHSGKGHIKSTNHNQWVFILAASNKSRGKGRSTTTQVDLEQ